MMFNKRNDILYVILLYFILAANLLLTHICYKIKDEYSFVMSFDISAIVTLIAILFVMLFFFNRTATYIIGIITSAIFLLMNFTSIYKEIFEFRLNINDEVYEMEHGVSRIDEITKGYYVHKILFVLMLVKFVYSIIMIIIERKRHNDGNKHVSVDKLPVKTRLLMLLAVSVLEAVNIYIVIKAFKFGPHLFYIVDSLVYMGVIIYIIRGRVEDIAVSLFFAAQMFVIEIILIVKDKVFLGDLLDESRTDMLSLASEIDKIIKISFVMNLLVIIVLLLVYGKRIILTNK